MAEAAVVDSVDGRTPRLSRNSRLPSQDQTHTGVQDPNIAALWKAIDNLDASEIEELAKKDAWTADTIVIPDKFRNPLHTLVLAYASSAQDAADLAPSSEIDSLNKKFQDCVNVMLENGVDINEGDKTRNTPLHLLAQHVGVDAAMQVLIDLGSKVNKRNTNEQTALHLACDEGTAKEVEVILRGGADPNQLDSSSLSSLHYAVKYRRNADVIKLLIEHGASVDNQNVGIRNRSLGPAPLHTAIRSSRHENVRLLLENDADPDVQDSSGQTPLHLAASYDVTGKITRMLLLKNASVNKTDFVYGETAMHKAIRRNMVKNVKVLCEGDAVLSIPDTQGESCLHRAAICCHDMAVWVALLSAEQADIRTRNAKAQTVLDRAARASNKLAVNVLKQTEG